MTEASAHSASPDRYGVAAIALWATVVATARNPYQFVTLGIGAALALSYWLLVQPERWVTWYLAAALLLPPLPVRLGDSGPHPAVLVAGVGLLSGLVRLRAWRRLPDRNLAAAFATLLLILLASLAPAALYSGPAIAAGSMARLALLAISVYVFFYAAIIARWPDPLRLVRRVYWISVVAALAACVDFYYQFPPPAGFGAQFVWLDSGVYRRAQGLFYEASTLGNFCAFFLVMIAVAAVRRPGRLLSRLSLVTGGAVFLTALMLSFSRASVLNVLTASAALGWVERRRLRWKSAVTVLLCCCLAAATAAAIFPVFASTWWLRTSASAQYLFSATEGVLSGRLASWKGCLALLQRNPNVLLFGAGYKTLPYSNAWGAPLVADNMYLSLLVETGVAGLAAMLWLSLCILRSSWRAARGSDPTASFLGTWMFCFWMGQMVQMFSGDLLTYWRVLGLYFWVLALAVRAASATEPELPG